MLRASIVASMIVVFGNKMDEKTSLSNAIHLVSLMNCHNPPAFFGDFASGLCAVGE